MDSVKELIALAKAHPDEINYGSGGATHRLHTEIIRAVGQPDVQEIFGRLGFEITTGTPEEFAKLIRSDMARVARVVHEAGIPVE